MQTLIIEKSFDIPYAGKYYSDIYFQAGDVVFVDFIHDLEKPFKYVEPSRIIARGYEHDFIIKLLKNFDIELTDKQLNALQYIHGEGEDYDPNVRVQLPLAAFVHICDVMSSRIWFDYPKK